MGPFLPSNFMETLEIINQRLKDNYGLGINDLPKYRVVWSTSQREVRTGLFVKQTEAGIYLGEAIKTEEVEKYPMYSDYWILECIQPNIGNHELKARYSYEPLWVFADQNGNPLPFDWEVIEKIIYFQQYGMAKPIPTQRELDHAYEEEIEREKAEMLDQLQHDEAFPDKMYDSKVVTVPSNYKEH